MTATATHPAIGTLVRNGETIYYAYVGAERVYVEHTDAGEVEAYLLADERVASGRVARVSARVKALIDSGMEARDAVDAILGAGTFAALASDVYDTLRARAAK